MCNLAGVTSLIYNLVMRTIMSIIVIYMYCQVIMVSHNALTVHYHLLCQRTLIATCNRRIPYYAYYTCQLGS